MQLHVETVAGLHDDPEPRAFNLGSAQLSVEQILDRWVGQEYSYFKLAASDKALYILRHDQRQNTWELTLFQSRST